MSADAVLRIAGSGPSGLAAAIELARRGHRVEVHERRSRAASRFWGGHQILAHYGTRPRPVDLLGELGLDVESCAGRWLYGATFHLPTGGIKRFDGRRPYAYLLRRGPEVGALDRQLLERARELGVEVVEGSRLDDARSDVIATGPDRVTGMAIEILYRCELDDRVDVLLDPRSFARGYAYLLVHEGWATLGVAALEDYKKLEDMAEHALCRFLRGRDTSMEEVRRGKHTMRYGGDPGVAGTRGMRVGEALGLQDYLFGLGIGNALHSGILAARCLHDGSDYRSQLNRRIRSRMRASEVDRWLYERGWLGWLLMRLPGGQLGRGLDWLHRGSCLRAPLSRWVGHHR